MRLTFPKLIAALTLSLLGCANPAADTTESAAPPVDQASDELQLSALPQRARRGLDISPVPLATAGLTGRQLQLVGYGSYLVNAEAACTACHSSAAGYLAGGNPFFLDASGHVVWTRNLTPDGATGMQLTQAQFIETMRTGRDFHPGQSRMMIVMPWLYFRWQSDGDLEAIYAYLRAIPAVANAVAPDNKDDLPLPPFIPFPGQYTDGDVARPLPNSNDPGNIQRGLAIVPVAEPRLTGLTRRDFGRGSYLANATMHCNECHTAPDRRSDGRINTAPFLTGGAVFSVPPPLRPVFGQVRTMSANLIGATNGFLQEPDDSYARFATLIRTRSHADESPARPLGFPMNEVAASLGNLLDEDLQALYTYLKELPPTTGAADGVRQDYARFCTSGADCQSGESCALATNECVGRPCAADGDCDVCQTCGGGQCQAPAPGSACLAGSL